MLGKRCPFPQIVLGLPACPPLLSRLLPRPGQASCLCRSRREAPRQKCPSRSGEVPLVIIFPLIHQLGRCAGGQGTCRAPRRSPFSCPEVPRGKHSALGMLQRGESGGEDASRCRPSGLGGLQETPAESGQALAPGGWTLGMPRPPCSPPPRQSGFSLSVYPSPSPEVRLPLWGS